jgi:hypothetical protein
MYSLELIFATRFDRLLNHPKMRRRRRGRRRRANESLAWYANTPSKMNQ